jgi:thiol-disulfide isomerase/thioredoxin
MTPKRILLLIVVLAAIVGAIIYLQSMNVSHQATVSAGNDLAVASSTTTPHSVNYEINKQQYPPAKELVSPDGYINTGGQPITIGSLVGKDVILVDFWTYSCINCQRTIPYLEGWYQKYKDYGFIVIGVHTPEFDFEKILANVQAGVTKFGITYPVVLDSHYNTWDAYGNNYWPEEYLIDIDGLVREHNIGEGNYAETEQNIQELLKERDQALGITQTIPTGTLDITQSVETNSPETYFDAERNQYLGNGKQGVEGVQTFTLPSGTPPLNTLYLGGTWNIAAQSGVNTKDGDEFEFTYDAKDVYFVASANPGVTITVLRDGQPLTTDKGADVDANSQVQIGQARLYTLIQQPDAEQHTLTVIVHGTGLNAFTLTFG